MFKQLFCKHDYRMQMYSKNSYDEEIWWECIKCGKEKEIYKNKINSVERKLEELEIEQRRFHLILLDRIDELEELVESLEKTKSKE